MSNQSYLLDNQEVLIKEKERLVAQAKLLFAIEQREVGVHLRGKLPFRFLDLGCGNGAYTALVKEQYPSAELFGFDRNPDLLAQADKLYPEVKFYRGNLLSEDDLRNVISLVDPTIVQVRLVLHHMSSKDRLFFLKNLKNTPFKGSLIIIDLNDSEIICSRKSPLLERTIQQTIQFQQNKGGDRLVGAHLAEECINAGFMISDQRTAWISLKSLGSESFFRIMGPVWKSYPNSEARTEIDTLVDSTISWLNSELQDPDFDLKIPLKVFICRQPVPTS